MVTLAAAAGGSAGVEDKAMMWRGNFGEGSIGGLVF